MLAWLVLSFSALLATSSCKGMSDILAVLTVVVVGMMDR
jgi:hypothetical protein